MFHGPLYISLLHFQRLQEAHREQVIDLLSLHVPLLKEIDSPSFLVCLRLSTMIPYFNYYKADLIVTSINKIFILY